MTAPIITPFITHVAVRYAGRVYSLPAPNRHHNVLGMIIDGVDGNHVEGFLLDNGKFVDRLDAMLIAQCNGQLNRRAGKQYYQGPELFSEDLW